MRHLKEMVSMSKIVFLERLSYSKALWVDIASVIMNILVYYFLWQIVSEKQFTGRIFSGTDHDICHFVKNPCSAVYRRSEPYVSRLDIQREYWK